MFQQPPFPSPSPAPASAPVLAPARSRARAPRASGPKAFLTGLAIALVAGSPALAQEEGDGPDSLRETFRDWVVQCVPAPQAGGGQACEMYQQIDHQQSNQRLLLASVRFEPEQVEPVLVLVAPFGLRLADGVELRDGETVVARYAFETCLSAGCLVIAPLELSVIDLLRRGEGLSVQMTARNGDGLGVPLSLQGFARAMDRLDALTSP